MHSTFHEDERAADERGGLLHLFAWPHKVINLVFTIMFVVTVTRIMIIRWGDPEWFSGLLFFFVPPAAALAYRNDPESLPSSRVLASVFLVMLTLGDFFALLGLKLPLNPFPGVSDHDSQVLLWYCTMVVVFTIGILPPSCL